MLGFAPVGALPIGATTPARASGAGAYTLAAAPGSYAQTGTAAALTNVANDRYFSNVAFLHGWETSNGTPTWRTEESSSHRVGTPIPDEGFMIPVGGGKFGGLCLNRNDTTRSITYPDHADFDFGAAPFTIETWVQFATLPTAGFHYLFGQWDTGASQRSWALCVNSGVLTLFATASGATAATKATAAWAPTTSTWYHVAADFDGTTYRTYVNGAVLGSETGAITLASSTAPFTVGSVLNSGAINGVFSGWLDETRITKGVARYAGAFAVPAATFPRVGTSGYTLAAAPGSYSQAGTVTQLAAQRRLGAAPGSYSQTGAAAALRRGYSVTAAPGSYTLSGTATAPRKTWYLAATPSAYTLSGTVAVLRRGFSMVVSPGSFSQSGTTTRLAYGRRLVAMPGAYALSGTAATLAYGRHLVATSGSHALVGTVAVLRRGFAIAANAGSYTQSGTVARLAYDRRFAAGSGAYAVAGADASLACARRLTATSGGYALTGTAVSVTATRRLVASAGSYSIDSPGSGLARGLRLAAGGGNYTLSGEVAGLRRGLVMAAAEGSYEVVGGGVTFHYATLAPLGSRSVTVLAISRTVTTVNEPRDVTVAAAAVREVTVEMQTRAVSAERTLRSRDVAILDRAA